MPAHDTVGCDSARSNGRIGRHDAHVAEGVFRNLPSRGHRGQNDAVDGSGVIASGGDLDFRSDNVDVAEASMAAHDAVGPRWICSAVICGRRLDACVSDADVDVAVACMMAVDAAGSHARRLDACVFDADVDLAVAFMKGRDAMGSHARRLDDACVFDADVDLAVAFMKGRDAMGLFLDRLDVDALGGYGDVLGGSTTLTALDPPSGYGQGTARSGLGQRRARAEHQQGGQNYGVSYSYQDYVLVMTGTPEAKKTPRGDQDFLRSGRALKQHGRISPECASIS